MDLDFEDPFLDFLLADSTSNVSSIEDKKRPREASEASDDGKSDGRRSTPPEPAKKRKKIDPVSWHSVEIMEIYSSVHSVENLRIYVKSSFGKF